MWNFSSWWQPVRLKVIIRWLVKLIWEIIRFVYIRSLSERSKYMPDVKKFLEVFPKNLLGLPPERDMEFAIELQSGTPITLEVVRWTNIWNKDFGGPLAYKVQLPKNLATVPNIFHMYQLKRFLRVPEHVLEMSNVNLQPDLTYSSIPKRFWIKRIGSLEEKLLSFTRYSGTSTCKIKSCSSQRSIWKSIFLVS
jgi:hypothetical protein